MTLPPAHCLPVETIACGPCILRPWSAADAESLVRHANDAEVSRALADHFPHPYTEADARAFLDKAVRTPCEVLAIEFEGAAIGGIGIHPGTGEQRRSAEFGYWLGRAYWGRGIMSAVIARYAEHVMREFHLLRLQARVFVNNPASRRVLEKCGFECEGILRRAVVKRGEILDVALYSRIRDGLQAEEILQAPPANAAARVHG